MKKKFSVIFTVFILTMIFAGIAESRTIDSNLTDETDKVYKPSAVDRRARTIEKPRPSARACGTRAGFAKFQAVFRKTGQVTDIDIPENPPCRKFVENALKNVRKIKFKPAMKDGRTVRF
jgi:hypothetical protein